MYQTQRLYFKLALCLLGLLKVAADHHPLRETTPEQNNGVARDLEGEEETVPPEPDQGIRGGFDETVPYSWLGVFDDPATGITCSVVLVHADIVTTTAACAEAAGFPSAVRIGSVERTSGGTLVPVSGGMIHPDYTSVTTGADIAVLKLNSSLTNTIALMNDDPMIPQTDEDIIFVAGFGLISNTESAPILQGLFYANIENCFERTQFYRPDFHICADATPTQGTCAGDAGSPAVVPGTRVVMGLNSFSNSAECESQTVDVYTRMSTYKPWVEAQICEMSANPPATCEDPKKNDCLFGWFFDAIGGIFGP